MTPALLTEFAPGISQEDVLRAIAHEIRQPLSAIESIAYYLSMAPPDNDTHREQLARIQQLVEQSNWILSNGLGIADPRPAEAETIDVAELITQTISARPSTDPPVECQMAADLPLARLDPCYGRSLIENLLGLFRQVATETHPARVRTSSVSNAGIEIEVSTAAPGYRSIGSLPPGSALSFDCAQRIAAIHGGSCDYSIDPASGIRVRVMLP